ncbi:ATP-dependent DNA helicase [Microbacterium sp. Marseille-Q6648]|uniref:ATP-dependent DNA helicase n=1 Tax=Microbacterium sp. Marseille-Q6648 TaxID=2937991 RepID=UPI0020409405|nr:ATP-dependent DNA helicase [Microbacterium sp. Marseille-Q6648]
MTTTPQWPPGTGLSASVIAAALGLPEPTADQRAVIEAPPTPALVIAGAGSGKTETMAGRVVWLVANGHVRRDEILGLTFTRKAAGELAERIGARLSRVDEYARRGLLAHIPALAASGELTTVWEHVAREPERRRRLALGEHLDRLARQVGTFGDADAHPEAGVGPGFRSVDEDVLLRARVSTYNAFADAIVREHAARIGRDADASLLSQSGSWLTARRVVVSSVDERLALREDRFGTVVDAVQRLAGEVLDNRVDLDELAAFGTEMAAAIRPLTNPGLAQPGDIEKFGAAMSGLPVLADLVRDYARVKQARGALDFADQVAGALEIVITSPDVAAELRAQYRVVLLDEYQDTSVIQTDLLAAVFHDTAVMAVGDPHQSIYGWRGASADNLRAFARAFARDTPCERFALMVSWRNDRRILDAANALIAGADADVPPLVSRPAAGEGRVARVFAQTIDEEAAAVADWFGRVRDHHAARSEDPHSGAILFRAKRHMSVFADALAARGIPHRILGLGGLLSTPEVVDVVAALRVLSDPGQGSSLIRLLVGPRFGVGVADMAALHELATTLAQRDASLSRLPDAVLQRLRGSVGVDEQVSIVDAVDVVRALPADYALLGGFTREGVRRIKEAGGVFERLRGLVGQPIPDLIRQIELELGLDVELAANETRGPARLASAQLRSFVDEVRGFLASDERGSIGSLLAWLDHAEETDELMPRPEPPEPGVVQLLTIHGSKGLEWDAVAVVRLVKDELPKRPRSTLAWLGYGVVPYRFRGDRDALPTLDWDPAAPGDRKSLQKAITEFKNRSRDHQEREERRLAYVAVTRARQDLLLSGSQWGGQRDARRPSPYLDEVIAALGLEPVALDETAENPYEGRSGATLQWPLDPLGGRAPAVLEAAGEVGAALAAPERAHPTEELDRLLRERAARAAPPAAAAPSRVAASRFKDFVEDFDKTVRALNRPLPERPFRQTRIGTLFHAWVENRSGLVGLSGSLDDGLWEADEEALESESALADAAEMDRLTSIFLASEWGRLQPIEVETEIDVTLGGATGLVNVICKLDAVYRRADRGGRIEIVDWKTGRPPATEAERDERMLQLALYRVAYHKRHGVPLADIDVALYYVADDLVIRSDRVYSEAELVQRWNAAREARSASRSASA